MRGLFSADHDGRKLLVRANVYSKESFGFGVTSLEEMFSCKSTNEQHELVLKVN